MAGLHGNLAGRATDASDAGSGFDFAAQYERSYRVLWVIAAGIASPQVAADIVHQAAVEALTKINDFQVGTDFTAWMAQIVRFTALNTVRTQIRHRAQPLEPQAVESTRLRPASHAPVQMSATGQLADHQQHFDDELLRALNELGEAARACLLLRTVQNLSYAQIAQTLDIPEGTAMSHVHRSRQQLRARLHSRTAPVKATQDPHS